MTCGALHAGPLCPLCLVLQARRLKKEAEEAEDRRRQKEADERRRREEEETKPRFVPASFRVFLTSQICMPCCERVRVILTHYWSALMS